MRVTIITVGSRGDVQPYVALGLGLQGAGHQVRLATHSIFKDFVRSRGLDFYPIAGNPRETVESEAGREFLTAGRNSVKALWALRRVFMSDPDQVFLDCWNACQSADAVLYSALGFAGYHIAQKRGIPSFGAFLQPFSRTREFPMMSSPRLPALGGWYNLLTYVAGEQIFWHTFRPVVNRWRTEFLGLPPAPFLAATGEVRRRRHPVLYGFSPSVVPRPHDWGEWLHVTGYWFLDRPDDWQPPQDLADFLESGPPPVYVGFGSAHDHRSAETTELVLSALTRMGRRGVLLTGWGGLSNADSTDDVFVTDSVPHDWLFPQMAAVVHHGGAGTTSAGLRAGVPSVLVPFAADQFFWGDRVADLGVGPAPVPRKRLTAERLTRAIQAATSETATRRAADLGRRIRAEHGVSRAVAAFEHHVAEPGAVV